MNNKKHIDRLFQEKLKDFEVFPDAEVWKNIEEQLVKKKKRRVFPLWLRLGSAAAILLLLITGSIWFYSAKNDIPKEPNSTDIITDVDTEKKKDKVQEVIKPAIENEHFKAVEEENSGSIATSKNRAGFKNTHSDQVAGVALDDATQTTSEKADKTQKNVVSNKTIMAQVRGVEPVENGAESLKPTPTVDNSMATVSKMNGVDETKEKKDIIEVLKEEKASVALEQNESKNNKWSIGSTVAPIYFNTLSEGSPIHTILAENEKKSITSLSYGVKVNYRINKKLSLQSGINALDLAYQTKNVAALITSTNGLSNDTNINTNVEGIKIVASSNNENATAQTQEFSTSIQNGSLANLNGDLNQTFSYIEVPMEAKYALLQKKLGLHVIGGLSTYVLYNKGVALQNDNGSTMLGEASNVNDLNFSGNIGIDVDYNISKKLFINVSPMFKYQLNTFSKNDGGFQPYFLGIYTGLNFRF